MFLLNRVSLLVSLLTPLTAFSYGSFPIQPNPNTNLISPPKALSPLSSLVGGNRSPNFPPLSPLLPANPQVSTAELEQLLLEVSLNEQKAEGVSLLLRTKQGGLLAASADLQKWRLPIPSSPAILFQQQSYYALDDLQGVSYEIEQATMRVKMTVPTKLFNSTNIIVAESRTKAVPPPPLGGFVNYDLLAQRVDNKNNFNALLEGVTFNRYGVGDGSLLVQNYYSKNRNHSRVIRLNTTWTIDCPEKMSSIRFGDAVSGVSSWGNSVSFTGIQWGRNFSTQPYFISYPLFKTHGEAVVPSTVDLYVNNALMSKKKVEPGPFDIRGIPFTNGLGQVNVVTTDLLGRQQVLSLPYYASGSLLEPGLHDFSFETGFIRKNFGSRSNDYGDYMFSGTDRRGITNNITSELHGELTNKKQALGVGATLLVSSFGIVNTAIAASHSRKGIGELLQLGFERQTPRYNFSIYGEAGTAKFEQIGLENKSTPIYQLQAGAGFPILFGSNIGFSYIRQKNRDCADVNLVSASLSNTVMQHWFVNVSAMTDIGSKQHNRAAFLTITRPLGNFTSGSLNAFSQNNNSQGGLQIIRNLPLGNGFGYNVQANAGKNAVQQAGVTLQNDVGRYTTQLAQQNNNLSIQADATGSVAFLGGHSYLTRPITNSFGVVEVGEFANVGILADNQIITHTNKQGRALIPTLRSYENNKIGINIEDLPMDAFIEESELNVTPSYRSGALVKFPVKRAAGGLLSIMLSNGKPLPPGSTVILTSDPKHPEFPVAENGQIYATGLAAKNIFQTSWEGQTCEFSVDDKVTKEPLPDLGQVICKVTDNKQ
ncbi:fimbria/pilus outer membrane usher protein [soil metagenome]